MDKMATAKKIIPRIITLDLMRGYFLLAILLNHLYLFPSLFEPLTLKGELFVSAAEGFFFISGTVLGIVRGRKLMDKPLKIAAKLLLSRAFTLYVVYIVVAIGSMLIGWQFIGNPGVKEVIPDPGANIFTTLWNIISFQDLYGWADYLRLYCLFLVASPLVLWLLRRGWWYIALGASAAIALFAPSPGWPDSIYTQPWHWQLLFFGGMIIGYHWPEITEKWNSLAKRWRQVIISTLLLAAVATLLGNIYLAFGGKLGPEVYAAVAPLRDTWQQLYFDKENMPFTRIGLFLLWFWAAFWLFRRFEPFITKWLGWLLLPFGTNSQYVYTVSAVGLYLVHLALPPTDDGNYWLNSLVYAAFAAVIWVMIRYKVLFKVIPR